MAADNQQPVSFRTDEQTLRQLDALAEKMDRSRGWVINEALEYYLDLRRWQIEEIKKGIADSEAGRSFSEEQVQEHFAKKKTRASR
ncbi:MAG TPA: ribbon-helix-helix protein, CopG family [Bryobacteraceae bacterium]|nr:ribbon-helix-helix protein, CopG family [Bryobacteraceae bacterium]